jgi:hypothetical protein
MAERPSARSVRVATAVCFAVPFALYAVTAARTVQGGDTGEFGLVGVLGGVAHPPGYPLYSFLVRLAARFPFGPPFWRVSLASVLCGAAAAAVLFRTGLRLTHSVGASVVAALAFAVSPLEWRLSGVPEVFSLHALASVLLVLCSLRVAETGDHVRREAFVLGVVAGLAASNHQTAVLLAPIAIWALLSTAPRGGASIFAVCIAGAVIGLSSYLLLPVYAHLASSQSNVWGRTGTLDGLITHVLRREYGTFNLYSGDDRQRDPLRHVLSFITDLPRQYAYLGFLAGLLGVGIAIRRQRGFALALLASFVLAGFCFPALFNLKDTAVNRDVTARFHLLPNLLFGLFAVYGLAEIESRIRGRVAVLLAGAALVLGASASFRQADWAGDSSVERLLIAEVQATQPNALIVGISDTTGSGIAWVTRERGIRPDVHYIDVNMVTYGWYVEEMQRALPGIPLRRSERRADPGQLAATLAPFAPTYVIPWVADQAAKTVQLEPDGFLDRVVPHGSPSIPITLWEQRLDAATRVFGDQPAPVDANAAMAHLAVASQLLKLSVALHDAGQTAQAAELEERVRDVLPPGWESMPEDTGDATADSR